MAAEKAEIESLKKECDGLRKKIELKQRKNLKGHLAKIYALQMVTASQDGKLLVWDTFTGNKRGSGQHVCLWDLETGKQKTVFTNHIGDCMTLALSPDMNCFISGACDSLAKLWDIRDGTYQEVTNYRDSAIKAGVTSLALSRSGRILIAGYDDFNCNLSVVG
ncbi:hypothetical protein NHX12_023710, partial [Muraenolepis orangiensis]